MLAKYQNPELQCSCNMKPVCTCVAWSFRLHKCDHDSWDTTKTTHDTCGDSVAYIVQKSSVEGGGIGGYTIA